MIKLVLIDNYDSFTLNLYDYFKQLNCDVELIRNDAISLKELLQKEYDGMVISPGPGTPKNAKLSREILQQSEKVKPVLGICLGHQAIGQLGGMKLKKAVYPMHGKTSAVFPRNEQHYLFEQIPSPFQVMRYHSLILEETPAQNINILATTAENEIMMVEHVNKAFIGMQFHPESVLTTNGLQLLKNWLKHFFT